MSSNADDYAQKRGPRLDAEAKDRNVLSRLAKALDKRTCDPLAADP